MCRSDVTDELTRVVDEVIRPALNAHGGDIGSYSFQDGVFRFRFSGTCAQCPSAWTTAEQIVASTIKARLPQVREIVMEQGVSEELTRQALDILQRRRR